MTALFAYVNYQGERRLVEVREVRDTEQVRRFLEGLLGTEVTAR